jgi:hypothetical protein
MGDDEFRHWQFRHWHWRFAFSQRQHSSSAPTAAMAAAAAIVQAVHRLHLGHLQMRLLAGSSAAAGDGTEHLGCRSRRLPLLLRASAGVERRIVVLEGTGGPGQGRHHNHLAAASASGVAAASADHRRVHLVGAGTDGHSAERICHI